MNGREKIITYYIELNRALKEDIWASLNPKDLRHLYNSINGMTIDVLNGEMFTIAVENALSWLKFRTSIDVISLRNLLLRPPQKYNIIREFSYVEYENHTDLKVRYTEIDNMVISVPNRVAKRLLQSSVEDLTSLVERYYILQPDNGFFWSAPPELYRNLSTRDPGLIEIIEGFGSPFNHNNLDHCCSLYKDDMIFGMIGNFFQEVTNRGTIGETGYRRWIINPPFTIRVMRMVYEAISVRLNSFPHDEYYFILPDWAPMDLVNFLEVRGTVERLIGGCYYIYNHLNDEYITPSNNLIFASTIANDPKIYQGMSFILSEDAQNHTVDISLSSSRPYCPSQSKSQVEISQTLQS